MSHATLRTPFGELSLFEHDGAVIALEWGRAPPGTETSLLREALAQLDAYFDGRVRVFSLPMRPAGTAFQQQVWQRLQAIPYGVTQSYGELAAELATSPRALARACATNPLPILVPCHRVISASGRLGGYSGGDGAATKLALLRLENAVLCPLAAPERPHPQ
jgi:methylated-DNA-[protein]-cysteine S-methyltransferase